MIKRNTNSKHANRRTPRECPYRSPVLAPRVKIAENLTTTQDYKVIAKLAYSYNRTKN